MADVNGAADAAAVTATPAQSTEQVAENQAQSDGDAWRNPQEIKKYFQRTQRLEDGIAEIKSLLQGRTSPEQAKSRSEKPPSEVESLRSELAFKDLVADVAPHLNRAQRERLSKLHSMERPSNPEEWVAREVAALGWARDATARPPETQTTAPPKAAHVTNTGAPGTSGGPAKLADAVKDPVLWKQLSPADQRKAWDEFMATDPGRGRVFAKR